MIKSRKIKLLKWLAGISVILLMLGISAVTVFAAGDVSSAIESTWTSAQTQIKSVVNNVVFPAVDMILAILFFVELATAYLDYRKHGQFEFTAPAILFGWALFVAGTVVAVFDVAIEYQNGRANIKTTAINVLKGFFACSLFGVVPVELYKFCISLQNTFSKDLSSIMAGQQSLDLSGQSTSVLEGSFAVATQTTFGLLNLLCMIAFAYCVIKIFFANIKRGRILLIQMAVGSLYMFSVPRGYQDGFNQWMKQIAALCLTAFMQTTLLFLGLLTFPGNMLLGLGIMLASNEVPRIAQQFGLDSSVKEYTKPLFSIPTHHFLFFPGNINPKDFEDALMVEPNEYVLIKFGERGTCLYRCGNERYLLLVQAPEYKAEIFGSAGGR